MMSTTVGKHQQRIPQTDQPCKMACSKYFMTLFAAGTTACQQTKGSRAHKKDISHLSCRKSPISKAMTQRESFLCDLTIVPEMLHLLERTLYMAYLLL